MVNIPSQISPLEVSIISEGKGRGGEGRGEKGLKERGSYNFLPLKKGGLLERGGRIREGGGLIEDLPGS